MNYRAIKYAAIVGLVGVIAAFAPTGVSRAGPVAPGFDLFETQKERIAFPYEKYRWYLRNRTLDSR